MVETMQSLKYVPIFQRKTHLWETVVWETILLGNCPYGKLSFWETSWGLSSGKLTFWETVILGNFLLEKFLWEKSSAKKNSGKLPSCNGRTEKRFSVQKLSQVEDGYIY